MKILNRLSKITMIILLTAVFMIAPSAVVSAQSVHTVTFFYGTKYYQTVVPHGGNAIAPIDTAIAGLNFRGWKGNVYNVTEDRVILGMYANENQMIPKEQEPVPPKQEKKIFRVRFIDSLTGQEYYKQSVSEGAYANPPEPPAHYGYSFTGYNGSFTDVDSDRTVYATYHCDYGIYDPNTDTYYFKDENGNIIYFPAKWL